MTEKRFAEVKGYCYDKKTCIGVIQDDYTCKNMINLLNEQEEEIQELKQRNQRQYELLKELTELMYERQWGKLENMVEEWEKADELLQKEWHNYGDL